MSRETELSSLYRELTSAAMRLMLVGMYEAAGKIFEAMDAAYRLRVAEIEAVYRARVGGR